jgi:hypothetical protein
MMPDTGFQISRTYPASGIIKSEPFWENKGRGEGFVTPGGEEGQFREQARASICIDCSLRSEMVLRFEVTWQKERK